VNWDKIPRIFPIANFAFLKVKTGRRRIRLFDSHLSFKVKKKLRIFFT
jgi:hypothetical protein